MSEISEILSALEKGEAKRTDELLPAVYNELRRLAAQKMANERAGHTLGPTELVHEAWLKLVNYPNLSWQNRSHFFSAAAQAMRRILIDRARRKNRQRHGSGAEHVDAHAIEIATPVPADELLALDEALQRFEAIEPKQAELVKLRYFVGLKIEEAAEILGISEATAKRWWTYARAWLFHELGK